MKEDEIEASRVAESNRVLINVTLLGICFTLFTFLIAFNLDILKENIFVTLQLVCAIPLMMTSLFARTKAVYLKAQKKWKKLGFITFLIGYSFMINVVGIFLISFISLFAGLVFYIVNILLALVYSRTQVSYDHSKLKERFFKDIVFILILILLGILPAIGIY